MRVLMSIAEMASGGAEAVVSALSSAALDRGDQVTIASGGGWRTTALSAAGADIVALPMREAGVQQLLRATWAMRSLLRDEPAGVIHTHNVRATLTACAASRLVRHRPPIVTTIHGLAPANYATAAKILNRCSDHVVAVSSAVANDLRTAGLKGERLTVIENAAPPAIIHNRSQSRLRLDLPAHRQIVLCAARMIAPKRHDLLMEAWQQIDSDTLLLLAGDGPNYPAIAEACSRHDFGDSVRLLGDRQDVDWLLAASDVVVLPSDSEGMPMIVVEAMAAGVPVIASAVGALPSLNAANPSGNGPGIDAVELVEPGSAAALARALTHLLSDEARKTALIDGGLRATRERFSPASMSTSYLRLYSSLAKRKN